ncbi:MAG TPA: hypothetical protein VGK20_10960 [Candidatus Binatia bacterium]|jgi:hypothetical protein
MRTVLFATAVAISVSSIAGAATTPAPGYIYSRQVLPQLTEGCVAHAPGGVYVGVGPALSFPAPGSTRSILFVPDVGAVRTVATGLNSIGDCVYDASTDTLYVTDSGYEFAGATTGDTVFAIPGDATNEPVAGHEVLAAGSIPFAFSIDLFPGGLLVSNAAGNGNGTVIDISLAGMTPTSSLFAAGFDYTGGIIVDGSRVLVSSSSSSDFSSTIFDYSTAGVLQGKFSGPTYDHGTIDLAVAADAGVLATGSPTLVSLDSMANVTPLVTGLDGGTGSDAFGGGVSVDSFTGRIDFLASTFSGADDDKSVHRLVPIDHLVTGGGNPATDCVMELYGIPLAPASAGRPPRVAFCTDGDSCDADGKADGVCHFPLGICLNVSDPRLPTCTPSSVASIDLLGANPASDELTNLVSAAAALMPTSSSTCAFSAGIPVPLRLLPDGSSRAGKALLHLAATTGDDHPHRDNDAVRLVCEPAP